MHRFNDFIKYIKKTVFDDRKNLALLMTAIILAILSCLCYYLTMLSWTEPGFPLDDSWIHIQFARSIYDGHPWEYSNGYPCSGTTSPLWSIVLSSLFFVSDNSVWVIQGTYIISIIFYTVTSFLVGLLVKSQTDSLPLSYLSIAAYVLVPRNTWLMMSGMEGPLFMFLILVSLSLLNQEEARFDIPLGIVVGLLYLTRPEGIIIAVVCYPVRLLAVGLRRELTARRLLSLILMGVTTIIVIAPWVLYCYSTTGYPLPDTFYVKVGLVHHDSIGVWNTFWSMWLRNSPYLILGLFLGALLVVFKKPYVWLSALSLALLYRETMAYQSLVNNARYLVPVFNLLSVSSIIGVGLVFISIRKWKPSISTDWEELLLTTVVVSIIIVPMTIAYWQQAQVFGNAVKNINEQQVFVGKWVAKHLPEESVLAICDAGAIKFFGNRRVIDLIGLMTPDIAHSRMTPEDTLQYLKQQGCTHMVLWGGWISIYAGHYCHGVRVLLRVHLSDNIICGGDTMVVAYINWTRLGI